MVRLWLTRQGLLQIDTGRPLTAEAFVQFLEEAGALQVDSVNVVDRAHYLTLWSRFGTYDRKLVDSWIYEDKLAYEYWGHEASILPISQLRLSRRRMHEFPPSQWTKAAYWSRYETSDASKRRVMRLLRKKGPLESSDFERNPNEPQAVLGWGSVMPKEDKRSLGLLWHAGKTAIVERRHFRKVFGIAESYYPKVRMATQQQFEDSWILTGLSGNGFATEEHLANYFTTPILSARDRKRVVERLVRRGVVRKVQVSGFNAQFFALSRQLDALEDLPEPQGLTLICPFDSLLWQRKRAEQLFNFRYRVEIYVPEKKREFGYYVLPVLFNGALVGRIDPKFHRDRQVLEIKNWYFEPGFQKTRSFQRQLKSRVESLAQFLGARDIMHPRF